MKLVENWTAILWRSLSLWCLYVAGMAGAVHAYIGATPNGAIPDGWVAAVDGWAMAVMFISGELAIPARVIQQVSISPSKPK